MSTEQQQQQTALDNKSSQEKEEKSVRKASLMKRRLYELAELSTVHALPNAIRSPHTYIRVIWFAFFSASCVACSYITITSILNYFSFEILVRFDLEREMRSEFPAVTFCNLNPIDFNRYPAAKQRLIDLYLSKLNDDERNQTNAVKRVCQKSINTFIQMALIYSNSDYFGLGLRDKLLTIDDMLISCYFNQQPCSVERDFKLSFSGIYGNCYTFNSAINMSSPSSSTTAASKDEEGEEAYYSIKPGEANGLQLELYVGDEDQLPCWAPTHGAFISVHNRSIHPLFIEDGKKVRTNTETNLVISRMFVNYKGKPYGNCVEDKTKKIDNPDAVYFNKIIEDYGVYSQAYCMTYCAAQLNLRSNKTKCLLFSNYTADELKTCLETVANYETFYPECLQQCPLECSMWKLNAASNFASYPSKPYAESLLENYPDFFANKNLTAQSILAVNVFYDTLVYVRIDEVPATSFGEVLANVGGQMGLFLGISILSFLELFEMIHELIYIYFFNKQNMITTSKSSTRKQSMNRKNKQTDECRI